jgi:pyrophosphatase PpaX
MYEAYLFDLDGTLIDSIGLIRASFDHTLAAHGLPALSHEAWLEGLGRPLAWQFGTLVEDPAEIEALIQTYRTHNLAHHDALVTAYPGAVRAVEQLAQSGARLGIVTSKIHHSARRGLALCGFGELFEVVVAMDDVQRHKPDPEPARCALERLGVEAERALMIGDSPHDLRCGRAAGTRTAAVGWGPFPRERLVRENPDHWLTTFADLEALMS